MSILSKIKNLFVSVNRVLSFNNSKIIQLSEIRSLISDWIADYPYDAREDMVSIFNNKYPIEHFIFSGRLYIIISPTVKLNVVEHIENTTIKIEGKQIILLSDFLKNKGCYVPNNILDWTDEECSKVTNIFKHGRL